MRRDLGQAGQMDKHDNPEDFSGLVGLTGLVKQIADKLLQRTTLHGEPFLGGVGLFPHQHITKRLSHMLSQLMS